MADSSALEDEVFDMANLSEAQTGIRGVVYISTRVTRHGPRVKYYEKPGADQASFSVSISESPAVLASDLPARVVNRISPRVIEWVRLNREALLDFWHNGDAWMDEKVTAFKSTLVKAP